MLSLQDIWFFLESLYCAEHKCSLVHVYVPTSINYTCTSVIRSLATLLNCQELSALMSIYVWINLYCMHNLFISIKQEEDEIDSAFSTKGEKECT
jgi:hypothetical protein